jgi:hypothetical protein
MKCMSHVNCVPCDNEGTHWPVLVYPNGQRCVVGGHICDAHKATITDPRDVLFFNEPPMLKKFGGWPTLEWTPVDSPEWAKTN